MPGLPGPGRPLDGTPGLPDLRLGGVFRRLTEPARQGALRGDRPPARPPSGAGIAVAMVLCPPASRLTRQAPASAASFMPSLPLIRLVEPLGANMANHAAAAVYDGAAPFPASAAAARTEGRRLQVGVTGVDRQSA